MKKRVVKIIIATLISAVLLSGITLGVIVWYIQYSVQKNCVIAQQVHPHPDDDVAALIDFMNSGSHSFLERTHLAVWTLGRLHDPKALPALESVYTGELCKHDKFLCQYELAKAIKQCGGTPSPPRKTKH